MLVDLMTHPAPKQASDFYTRLEMLWPAMCEAILKLRLPEAPASRTERSRGSSLTAAECVRILNILDGVGDPSGAK
jgi:hypothetical protein